MERAFRETLIPPPPTRAIPARVTRAPAGRSRVGDARWLLVVLAAYALSVALALVRG